MKVYGFVVKIASDNLDSDTVENLMTDALTNGLPDDALAMVGADGVKEYSEQGWKNARARLFGVKVADAGDGHKAKKIKEKSEELVNP